MGKVKKSGHPKLTYTMVATHKDDKMYLRKCMIKWHDWTQGVLQWPKEGTFAEQQCQEVRKMMRHWKVGKNYDKTRGKRVKKLEVLSWFEEEGREIRTREESAKKVVRDEKEGKRKQESERHEEERPHFRQNITGKRKGCTLI